MVGLAAKWVNEVKHYRSAWLDTEVLRVWTSSLVLATRAFSMQSSSEQGRPSQYSHALLRSEYSTATRVVTI